MAKNIDEREDPEAFKTDPALCERFNFTAMTLYRWRKQGIWPQPDLTVNNRNYTKNRTVAEAERHLIRFMRRKEVLNG